MMSCDKCVALVDAQGSKTIAMLKAILCPIAKTTVCCMSISVRFRRLAWETPAI